MIQKKEKSKNSEKIKDKQRFAFRQVSSICSVVPPVREGVCVVYVL